jgi:hypothetical protein
LIEQVESGELDIDSAVQIARESVARAQAGGQTPDAVTGAAPVLTGLRAGAGNNAPPANTMSIGRLLSPETRW